MMKSGEKSLLLDQLGLIEWIACMGANADDADWALWKTFDLVLLNMGFDAITGIHTPRVKIEPRP